MSNSDPRPNLGWTITLAHTAAKFFGPVDREEPLRLLGRTDPPGTTVPFSQLDFIRYLKAIGYEDVWTHLIDIQHLIRAMAKAGILGDLGVTAGSTPLLGNSYLTVKAWTDSQSRGDLWLSEVLGPQLIIPSYGSVTIAVTGTSDGDPRIGSGLVLDEHHVVTNAHVVRDMNLDEELQRPATMPPVTYGPVGALNVRIIDSRAHDTVDVGVIRVEPTVGSRGLTPLDGLVFRDPAWSDTTYTFGYPRVPTAVGNPLIVNRGEVVNPSVQSMFGEEFFLYSALTRGGNSGGPIVAQDGRVLGLVTDEAFDKASTEAPFYRGIPAQVVVNALDDLSFGGIARMEDWGR